MKRKAYNMTVEEIDAATVALNKQQVAMPFLVPVSPEGKGKTQRLASKAVKVAEKRLKAAREHGEALPPGFDLRGFERDVTLMRALVQCRDAAARVHTAVQDTLNHVGTNAFRASSEAYAHIKAAFVTSPGLQRTVGDLSARRSKSKGSEAEEQAAAASAPQAPPTGPSPDKKAA